jgi:hypothetical protein
VAKLIGEFLVELSEDPALLEEYSQDARGVLQRRSGLAPEQQDVLLGNDLKRIRKAIQDEYKKAEVIVVPLPCMHIA